MKSKILFLTKYILPLVLLVFGVPMLINVMFGTGNVNSTVFNASELLSYYGSVLSAGITLCISVLTIQFTKKQIRRQAYVDREKEKWLKVEHKVAEIITKVNPLNLLLITVTDEIKDITKTMGDINSYGLDCKIATDELTAYVNRDEDFPKIRELVENIQKAGLLFYDISKALCGEYNKVGLIKTRAMAIELIQKNVTNSGIIKQEELSNYYAIIQQTDGLNQDDILKNIGNIKMQLVNLYENEYRAILGLKGSTFKVLMDELDNNSFKFLDE